jgi:hypothetical protein
LDNSSTSFPVGQTGEHVALRDDSTISAAHSRAGYFSALAVATFFAAYSYHLEFYIAAATVALIAWILIPLIAVTDRIIFDGRRIYRVGIAAQIRSLIDRSPNRLKIKDIEVIETQATRSVKRGANIRYRYKTTIRGRGMQFSFTSGDKNYRKMVRAIFPLVPENVSDSRSIELRDYLADPKETMQKAASSQIPSADVLEDSFRKLHHGKKSAVNGNQISVDLPAKAADLHSLGNELRISGFLLQALEAFRRALLVSPHDGQLLFDFGRCLQSISISRKSDRLRRRSVAALCLAERYSDGNADLLTRLGEAYFQADEWHRAESIFKRVTEDIGDNFRAIRGLAEIALHEGKIAHVIHHFSTANRIAATPALRRWSRHEADYFSRLNDDEEYMDIEIARVNLLEKLEKAAITSLKIVLLSLPTIIVGTIFDDALITDIGWAVSAVAIIIWAGLTISQRLFRSRIPFEIYENEK